MTQIFGDFVEVPPTSNEFLVIGFSPSSIPLKHRWRNNGLSANFMADYVTTFVPKSEDDPATANLQNEIKSAVSFIVNELLENAMKFSDYTVNYPISIQLYLKTDRLIFVVVNSINQEKFESFQLFIEKLIHSDSQELYIEQVEKSLDSENSSGLGYLTMINDYLARLGWKFEALQTEPKVLTVTTMVQLFI
ncbi:MAG: ATP-binding protein [Planktothrix sp. GU0601_MAG3]|nr:MAG: ATP-binding protein [Planktothrix sp. GU0601_MAG3]